MHTHDHVAPALGAGLGFLLIGTALLLQELGRLTLSWAVVLPLILISVGLATALAGVAGASRHRG